MKKNLGLFIFALSTCMIDVTSVHAATTLQKAIQPQATSLKTIASSTSGTTSKNTDASTLISNEILRLCKKDQGCEFILPTQSLLDSVNNDSLAKATIEDFATAISQGSAPREAALLAAIDPNNAVLASTLPEFANRLSQISRISQTSIDPRTGLGDLQNPNVGFRQVVTVGVGADGRPTYTVSQRSSQFGDPIRAGLSYISDGAGTAGVDGNIIDAGNSTLLLPKDSADPVKDIIDYTTEAEPNQPRLTPTTNARTVPLQTKLDLFLDNVSNFFGSDEPQVVRPGRTDQSPDAIGTGGPQIAVEVKRPSVIDPADAIQNVDLSNRFPTGSVVDPNPDGAQSTVFVPVTSVIRAKTIDGRIIPLDQGSGLTNGTFESTLQADLCDAAGNCN